MTRKNNKIHRNFSSRYRGCICRHEYSCQEKRASSVYESDKNQQNPFEGKKVVLVEDENDKENADGVKGHLEAVGDAEDNPSFYEKYIKRAFDVVLSFGGLVVLSPILPLLPLL